MFWFGILNKDFIIITIKTDYIYISQIITEQPKLYKNNDL